MSAYHQKNQNSDFSNPEKEKILNNEIPGAKTNQPNKQKKQTTNNNNKKNRKSQTYCILEVQFPKQKMPDVIVMDQQLLFKN